jgi:hypothetical protein
MGTVASAGVGLSGLMRAAMPGYSSAGVRLRGSAFHRRSLPSRCGGIYATGCHRDVEELLAERGVQVDHVSMFRWA